MLDPGLGTWNCAMEDTHQYLDPLALAKVRSLELQARLIVEGYLSGMHKSPYHGFSVEFAQHREYVPGDDIKHIDWKVYGRTGRFYLKQYEEETNLVCWLLLDVSESMHYGSGPVTQVRLRLHGGGALAYLILHQHDSVGLVTFDNQVRHFRKPSSQPSHLKEIVHVMTSGPSREKTRLGPIFHDLAERINRRALIFILSDLFDDVPDLLAGLKHLRHKRHEVVLLHVLDAAELDFPFQEATLFRGLEQYPELLTDPRSLRQGYLEEVDTFLTQLQHGCRDQNIDYVQLRTDAISALPCPRTWRIGCGGGGASNDPKSQRTMLGAVRRSITFGANASATTVRLSLHRPAHGGTGGGRRRGGADRHPSSQPQPLSRRNLGGHAFSARREAQEHPADAARADDLAGRAHAHRAAPGGGHGQRHAVGRRLLAACLSAQRGPASVVGRRTHKVLVLDGSFSMAAQSGDTSCFEPRGLPRCNSVANRAAATASASCSWLLHRGASYRAHPMMPARSRKRSRLCGYRTAMPTSPAHSTRSKTSCGNRPASSRRRRCTSSRTCSALPGPPASR